MLTGSLVRVRFVRNRIVPVYAAVEDPANVALAEQLLDIFQGQEWRTRGEIEAEITAAFGDGPLSFLQQGLAKLLEDRCEFEVVAGHPPDRLRDAVFRAAESARAVGPFDRAAVLGAVAAELKMTADEVEGGLFADLKSEQRMAKFEPITAERLLQRYNVALAQSVLLKAVGVEIDIRKEPQAKLRRVFRLLKFRRLVCDVKSTGPDSYHLKLDGPLSLFTATQKYGLQLALFLPVVLACKDWELRADLRWGPERKPKIFNLAPADGLVSHLAEHGTYVPPELAMFAEQFRKKATGWQLHDESAILPLGPGFWVPDFRLEHVQTGKSLYLEVLGFWRKSSAELHVKRLRQHANSAFLLAVSEQLKIDDSELDALPVEIMRFRQMPLPDEVMKRAAALLQLQLTFSFAKWLSFAPFAETPRKRPNANDTPQPSGLDFRCSFRNHRSAIPRQGSLMLARLLPIDRIGPRTGPNGTVIKTPAEKLAGKGRGNWACWDHAEKDILLAAAERWSKQIPPGDRYWLCWNIDDGWCRLQQKLVLEIGWTPVVGADASMTGRMTVLPGALSIDFLAGLPMPDVWTHFPLELVFGWADRLAFWHADVLLPRPILRKYARQFEQILGPVTAAAYSPRSAPTADMEQQRSLVRGDWLHDPSSQSVAMGLRRRLVAAFPESPQLRHRSGFTPLQLGPRRRHSLLERSTRRSNVPVAVRHALPCVPLSPSGLAARRTSPRGGELAQIRGRSWDRRSAGLKGPWQILAAIRVSVAEIIESPNHPTTQSAVDLPGQSA